MRAGADGENEVAEILWLHGHNVRRKAVDTFEQSVKRPDFRIDDEIFDAYTPASPRARNIWEAVAGKIRSGQTQNVIVFLRDTSVSTESVVGQFTSYSIPGLNRLWLATRDGEILYLRR